MKYSLTDFKGRFHTMPNVLLDFLPCDMYMVLAQIYVASRDVLYDGKIKVSRNALAKVSGLNRRTVAKCIEKLEQLNLLSSNSENRQSILYSINWEEIYEIEKFYKDINFDGECVARNMCLLQNPCVPFSSLNTSELNRIKDNYQYFCEEDKVETIPNKDAQNAPVENESGAFQAQDVKNAPLLEGNNEKTGVFRASSEESGAFRAHCQENWGISCKCSHDIFKEEDSYVLEVHLTSAEESLINTIEEKEIKVRLIKSGAFRASSQAECAQNTPVLEKVVHFEHEFQESGAFQAPSICQEIESGAFHDIDAQNTPVRARNAPLCAQNAPVCAQNAQHKYNNIIYNKIYAKRSFAKEKRNKKEIEEDFLKFFFDSRNLELPAFDKTLREDFLQRDLDDDDDDVIKTIKHVWGQLDYDEELPDNNFIDLRTFHNILAHSWEYLKSTYADYSLSEDETKNIFGFLVIEHEGEPCLYIDPSKLQDIHATETRASRRKSREGKFTDRTSRRFFVEAIKEIADKNDELLTDAEYAILLMMDYVEENKRGNFPVEVPKLFYRELLKDFSERSKVPVEDLQALFQDLPQKDKVKLSPMQLSPDRFFEYNSSKGQESEVERLLKEKLAEQD